MEFVTLNLTYDAIISKSLVMIHEDLARSRKPIEVNLRWPHEN